MRPEAEIPEYGLHSYVFCKKAVVANVMSWEFRNIRICTPCFEFTLVKKIANQ